VRIESEDFLIHDAPSAEVVQRAHHRAGASGFSDARDPPRPTSADPGHSRLVERLAAGRLLQLADAPDPLDELRPGVLGAAAQMRQLEVGVTVDEPRRELGIREMQRAYCARRRHFGVPADGGYSSGRI